MRRLLVIPLLVLAISLNLVGCSNEYSTKHQSQGDALVQRLHQAIQQGEWERLSEIYGPAYLEQNSVEGIAQHWRQMQQKLGAIRSFRLQSKQRDARLQGEFYFYRFTVLFERGSASETITVFRSGQNDRIAISGHKITVNRADD